MALTELVQASTAEASGAQRVSRSFPKLYALVAVSRHPSSHRTTAVQRDFESAGSRSPGTCCRRVLQETQSQGKARVTATTSVIALDRVCRRRTTP